MSFKGSPVVALIPARGGSKGVEGKNLRHVAGKPLIEYTIRAALGAKPIDRTYLSSDHEGILSVGRALGALPLRRSDAAATDTASAMDVVDHFLEALQREWAGADPYLAYLQPTSPLRTARHIEAAFAELERSGADSLLSVVELRKSPFKSFRLDERGRLRSLFEEKLSNARRQDLPKAYVPNGAIYVFKVSEYRSRRGFPSDGGAPFVMSEADSLDIDTEQDIQEASQSLG